MENRRLTPLKAIRLKCVKDCCAGKPSLVRSCENKDCPLFVFKSGHNPYRKGVGPHKPLVNTTPLPRNSNTTTYFGVDPTNLRHCMGINRNAITPQFLTEIEGVLDRVTNLVKEDTAHLIEKVKNLKSNLI